MSVNHFYSTLYRYGNNLIFFINRMIAQKYCIEKKNFLRKSLKVWKLEAGRKEAALEDFLIFFP